MSGPETAAFITLVITAGITITRVSSAFFSRNRDARPTQPRDAALEERLARIEHAVESIAIEVERVSEGQRFTTKLLAERANGAERVAAEREPAMRAGGYDGR